MEQSQQTQQIKINSSTIKNKSSIKPDDYDKLPCFDLHQSNNDGLLTWEQLIEDKPKIEVGNKITIPIPPSPEEVLINRFRIMMNSINVSEYGTLQPQVNGSKYGFVRDCLEEFLKSTKDIVMHYGLWDYRTSYFARIDGKNIIVHVSTGQKQWFYLTPDEIEKYLIDCNINEFPYIKEFMKYKI